VQGKNCLDTVLYKGKSIAAVDLQVYNDEVWCATQDHGILIFKAGVLHRTIDQSNGLGDQFVNKIILRDGRLFVSHKSGFQMRNLATKEWTKLGVAEGIIGGYVYDFDVSNEQLWMLADNTLLSINLKDLSRPTSMPKLRFDSIVVSGTSVESDTSQGFQHQQNHFKFYVDFRSVDHEAQGKILSRIVGFEEEWNSTSSANNLIEYKSMPPGEYKMEAKASYGELESEAISYSFQIRSPYWQQWWFYLLAAAGLVGIVAFAFQYQIRRIRKNERIKLEKQTMESTLLESQLKALRSQMNPHFIFNALNSIQDLILQQDTDASYDYIVLFADLVRSTLNYSNKEFIPVEKELEFLEVYLSLEELRFKDEFSYEIIYTGSKDIEVPSLIVQPFIENALLHGLLHKAGQKKLTIEFILKEQLICLVTDNGVGRKKAGEINERKGQRPESFAIEAIEKRLSILTAQYGEGVGFVINDLYENEEALGTRVEITMPYSRLY
jgi:hypothetical protein